MTTARIAAALTALAARVDGDKALPDDARTLAWECIDACTALLEGDGRGSDLPVLAARDRVTIAPAIVPGALWIQCRAICVATIHCATAAHHDREARAELDACEGQLARTAARAAA